MMYLMYAKSSLYGFPQTLSHLRDALNANPCEAPRQKRLMDRVAKRCDANLKIASPKDRLFDDLRTLRNACAACDVTDPDGGLARVLAVCALLDIEVRTGP